MILYHGSTHKFDKFSLKNAYKDCYYGPYLYLTTSSFDATDYYTNDGYDLKNKIDGFADELFCDDDSEFETFEEAREHIKSQIMGDGTYLYECSIPELNLFEVSSSSYEECYNEDSEEYEHVFLDYVDSFVEEFEVNDIFKESVIQYVMGEINSKHFATNYHYSGEECLSGSELVSEFIKYCGYDGIILKNIRSVFRGFDHDADHYTIFNPEHVDIISCVSLQEKDEGALV